MRALIALRLMRLRRSAFPVEECDALNTITAIAMRSAWLLMSTVFMTIFVTPLRSATFMTIGLDHAIAGAGSTAAWALGSGRRVVRPV